jgi:hypothetical protein
MEILAKADIVLHAESFAKKEIRKTRLSFSTKIIDCMQSGSCLLAIGPESTASIRFLQGEGIAETIVTDDVSDIEARLLRLIQDENAIPARAAVLNRYAVGQAESGAHEEFYRVLSGLLKTEGDNNT